MNLDLILTGILCLIIFGCGFWFGEIRGMRNGRIWWEATVLAQKDLIKRKDETIKIQAETIDILREGLTESNACLDKMELKIKRTK